MIVGNKLKWLLSVFLISFLSVLAIAGGKSDRSLTSDSVKVIDGKKKISVSAPDNSSTDPATAAALWQNAATGQSVEVSGKLRRVGNDPLTFLVITDSSDNDWYPDEAGSVLLQPYEQLLVFVHGVIELKEMTLANGKILGVRRILTGISIIR